ncbi:MAG TPA: response regulator transcription factor [Terriglobia bacterium]|nr:response regulator transcription factor [Terriglobia bacterium]
MLTRTVDKKILLVEDERGLLLTLSDRLRSEGYQVETATDGLSGFEQAVTGQYDLMILDIVLPQKSGLDICRDLRQKGFATPILMLTARGQVVDKVLGLKIGADDYLTKPFDMMELLARTEALLRRPLPPVAAGVYQFGNLRVEFRSTTVFRDGEQIPLSAREFHLLQYLIEHRGETVSREELLKNVWGYAALPATRTVDVHVAWLRQKLESDPKHPQYILTVQGLGYKFNG